MPELENKYAYIHQGSPANVYDRDLNTVIGYLYDNEVWWIRSYDSYSGIMTGYVSRGNGTYYVGYISNPYGASGLPPNYIDHGSGQGYSRPISTYDCVTYGGSWCSPWGDGGSVYTVERMAYMYDSSNTYRGRLEPGMKVVFGRGQGYARKVTTSDLSKLRMYGYINTDGRAWETNGLFLNCNLLNGRGNYNINTS